MVMGNLFVCVAFWKSAEGKDGGKEDTPQLEGAGEQSVRIGFEVNHGRA